MAFFVCVNNKVGLFKKKTAEFDIERDIKDPQDLKLLNTKMIGYKQCKNTFPSPQTEVWQL